MNFIKCTELQEETELFTLNKLYEFKFTGVKDTCGNYPLIVIQDNFGNDKFLSYCNGFTTWILNPNKFIDGQSGMYPSAIFRESK